MSTETDIYICTIAIAYLITLIFWERNLKEMEGSLSFSTLMVFTCRQLMICVSYSSPLELLI